MSNITQLKDKDGNNIYPISSDKLILDEQGRSIGERLTDHLENHPKGFSGNYNDLTNKPIIPSIAGLATETYVNIKVASLVSNAPETLDTLNELAKALGDDPNFATTISNKLGEKASTSYVNAELAKKADSSHTHSNYIQYEVLNGTVVVPSISILDEE